MNILKFSQTCSKTILILTGVLSLTLLHSCQKQDNEDYNNFLGSPKNAQISIRFIPNDWLFKQSAISTESKKGEDLDFSLFNSFSPNTPSVQSLIENFTLLQPDLSKNWVLCSGIQGKTKYVSIYLKAYNTQIIDSIIDPNSIHSKTENQEIKTYLVDDKINEHNYIVFSKDHIEIIKAYGNEDDCKELLKTCIYQSKVKYIQHFDTIFGTSRNDLDIRLKGDKKIGEFINTPILHELAESFNGSIGINIKENDFELTINPLTTPLPIDSIFKPFKAQEEAYSSLQVNLELNKLKSLLTQFNYLDDIEYELKKGNLTYSSLNTIWDGLLQLSYNGKIKKQEKSISYEFDDNFNEIEKIKYNTIESFDFEGLIGIRNSKNSLEYLLKNNFISKTRNNTYEPIVGSQSKIQINNKYIEIGNRRSNNYYKEKIKLLVSVNDLDKLHLPKKINQTLSFFQLKKAKLTVSEKNILHLKISFKGEKYEYFKSVWTFLNPELK